MLTTVKAEIETNGQVTLLEPVKITKKSRAIVTILDDEIEEPKSGNREIFGMWYGKELTKEEYLKLDHNERIDFDLAREYANNHEDEN